MFQLIPAAYDWTETGIVSATGVIIVFSVLVLFVAIIWCFGKIAVATAKKTTKDKPSKQEKKTAPPKKAAAPIQNSVAPSAQDDELIAVISAAVYTMLGDNGGRPYQIRSIRPVATGRSAWAQSGVLNNVRSF